MLRNSKQSVSFEVHLSGLKMSFNSTFYVKFNYIENRNRLIKFSNTFYAMLEMYLRHYIRGSFVSSDFSIIMTRTYSGFGNTEQ